MGAADLHPLMFTAMDNRDMESAMPVRRYRAGDEDALWRVYHSAIHIIAARDYTQEQVDAWAPGSVDPDLWRRRMEGINPFVVEIEQEIVGYADVQATGYIDHFFVSGHFPRRGIGALLMKTVHEEALRMGLEELTSDVSRTAQPFFARFGFAVVEQRCSMLRGVVVPNALTRKRLEWTRQA